jgi:hypothetical protein
MKTTRAPTPRIERLEGDNAQYAIGLGLGVLNLKPPKDRKPKYGLLDLGKQMDDAIRREFFKEDKLVPGNREKESHWLLL